MYYKGKGSLRVEKRREREDRGREASVEQRRLVATNLWCHNHSIEYKVCTLLITVLS